MILFFISEHWLLLDNLSILSSFNDQFSAVGLSGIIYIEDYVSKGGRPYSDLGVLWRKNCSMNVVVIDVEMNHRCMAVEIKVCNRSFICLVVYLLIFSNIDKCKKKIMLCSAFIDDIARILLVIIMLHIWFY